MRIILEVSPRIKTTYDYEDLEIKTKICNDPRGGESYFFVATSGLHAKKDIEIRLQCIHQLTENKTE